MSGEKEIISEQDILDAWNIFRNLRDPRKFYDICCVIISHNFRLGKIDDLYATANLVGSKDAAALSDLGKILARIKNVDHNFFLRLVARFCENLIEREDPCAWTLRNGAKVYSRKGLILPREILPFLPYSLGHVVPERSNTNFAINMNLQKIVGRHIGRAPTVETGLESEIVFGAAEGTRVVNRFVRNSYQPQTHWLWVSLMLGDMKSKYILRNAGFGKKLPPTPNIHNPSYSSLDNEGKLVAQVFWRTNAYVLTDKVVLVGETTKPPAGWQI
jgi:hypothetical protein